MMMKISNKLRNKLRRDLIIIENEYYKNQRHDIYDRCKGEIKFSKDEADIWFEAFDWMKHIEKYFRTSYSTYKIDCGRFRGICPTGVYVKRVATFYVDSYEDESWKDWFIMEGDEYFK